MKCSKPKLLTARTAPPLGAPSLAQKHMTRMGVFLPEKLKILVVYATNACKDIS
jgi:hypothetical protein